MRNSYSGNTHFKAKTNFEPSLWLLPAGGFLTPKKSRWAELAGARSWTAFSCSAFKICRIGGLWPFGLESLRHERIRCSPTNDPHQNWAARADCLAERRVTTAYRWTAQRRERRNKREQEGGGGNESEREVGKVDAGSHAEMRSHLFLSITPTQRELTSSFPYRKSEL